MDGPGVGGGGSSCGCGTSIPKQPRRWGAEESQASDNVSGESPGNRHTTAATGDRDDDSDDNKFLISSRSSKRFKSIVTPDSTDQMPNSNDISHNVTGFGLPSCSSMNASQASSQYSPTGTSPTHHITPAVLASLEMPSMRAKPRRFGQIDDEESLIHPFGVSAHRGPRRHMEDRFNIQGRVGGANAKVNVSMYGVFDGHGGASAANFAAEALVNNLAASSSFPEPQSLTQAYLTTDEQFLNTPRQLAGRDPLAGTTALVALVHGDRLITANVGDSRAVIVHANGSATQLTVDHRTHTASEHARIVAAGGTVTGGRVESILSMTRAIGDKRLKQFVIAKPDVKTHKVDESDHFLIIATDGIWDCISNTMAAAIVKCAADASYAANCLLAAASTCSTDNATVLVIDLQKRNKPPPPPQLPRVGAGLERELLHADTAATTINKLKSGGSGSGGDGVRVSTSDAGVMSPQSANVPTIAAVPAVPAVGRSKFRNLASVLRRTLTIEVDDDDDDE
jgi:serine/threonine protein phosphatase PrpC